MIMTLQTQRPLVIDSQSYAVINVGTSFLCALSHIKFPASQLLDGYKTLQALYSA